MVKKEFNELNIVQFIHCSLCIKEGIPNGESPETWARFSVGWTKEGLQIWCVRHKSNIVHIDFQGKKHPADLSYQRQRLTEFNHTNFFLIV